MARACLAHGKYSLPHGLGRPQVPLLIQVNDYAERLEKEYIPLKQFLITQWNSIHPNIAMKLLDELAQGHCLILFDNWDERASATARHVLDAIDGFITDFSSKDPNIYNCFIIASRITNSEHEAFSRYMHYTLLELDEQGIDWWDLTSLRIAANATEALALRRMCAEIAASAELWSTRNAGPVKLIASLLGRELRSFRQSRLPYDRGERLLDELLLVSRGGNQNVFHILVAKEDVEDVKPDDETAAIAAWGLLRFL